MPSFIPEKNAVILRSVSSIVLNLPNDIRSIFDPESSSILRKTVQSIYPLAGKDSSNMTINLISSVSCSLFFISEGFVENSSLSTIVAAYSVLHLSEIAFLTLSNPNFSSNLLFLFSTISKLSYRCFLLTRRLPKATSVYLDCLLSLHFLV